MSYDDKHIPTGLEKLDDNEISISWADGAETRLPIDFLRSKCPCAGCVDEWTGEVMVKYEDVAGVGLETMKQVGTYAFSIRFSDGHDTGIFTYKRLRELGDES